MIRINLLKPLEPQALPLILEEPPGRGRKSMLILGGLVLVAVLAIAVLQFPSLFGGMVAHEGKTEQTKAPPVPRPTEQENPHPKRVTSQAVEETVRDIQDNPDQQNLETNYADLVPSEKIELQYYASNRILKDIKSVTPPDIGFANFIFSPPGDFYVHGLAADEQQLQQFQKGLSGLAGASIRPGLNVPAGTHGKAKEFSFFGTVKFPFDYIQTPPDHTIPKAKLPAELKQLKTVAANLGIRLNEPKLISSTSTGTLKKNVYAIKGDCSFQQMQDLITDLKEAKSNLGFIKFAMMARGDEKVNAEMDIAAYVGP
ncbi:MAG: hypothetical protein JWP91_1757 [Fibrobacteres bacterium]|nr:hypothetical protein [Fibrobacterota bacterium]